MNKLTSSPTHVKYHIHISSPLSMLFFHIFSFLVRPVSWGLEYADFIPYYGFRCYKVGCPGYHTKFCLMVNNQF